MKENTLYLSFLRVCSILWVVLIQHNFAPYSLEWGWIEGGKEISKLLSPYTWFITALSMPLCMFISGYVLSLTKGLTRTSSLFFSKKIRRILLPCITMGGAFSLLKEGHIDISVFWGGYEHLWFLWYLFVYFTVSYFLIRNRPGKVVVVALLIVFCLYKTNSFIPHTLFQGLCSYYCFFLLGYLVEDNKDLVYKYKVLIFLLTILMLVLTSLYQIKTLKYFYSIWGVLSLWILVKHWTHIVPSKSLKFIDNYSYGIYIYHMPIIYLIYQLLLVKFGNEFLLSNAYWISTSIVLISVPLSIVFDFTVDCFINKICKK